MKNIKSTYRITSLLKTALRQAKLLSLAVLRWFQQVPFKLPNWLQSSATQQGLMFVFVSLLSLVLMASITIAYVDYQLAETNHDIVEKTQELVKGERVKIDDDPIEDDEILAVLVSGFILSGVLVSLITAYLVARITRNNQLRITRIEQVLNAAANGDLSARIGAQTRHDDLARISGAVDEMLYRLENSVAAMSDISANIAHELKTPITRLQHNLLDLYDHADQQAEPLGEAFYLQLEASLSESRRLADIFDALLRISQIESGQRRKRFAKLDLIQLVSTIDDIYADVCEDAGMTLKVHLLAEPLWIQGDRELLVQQLANLVENALRYCPDGSQIDISVGHTHDQVIVEVRDNGPGIEAHERQRVFERLYRVDKSRNDGGLGLGLSLAKAVAELHYGEIQLFDNVPGLGVRIIMPIQT